MQPVRRDLQRDSYIATAFGDVLDRSIHAMQARVTGGLSPAALTGAYLDWATHLTSSPGKQIQLIEKAFRKSTRFARHTAQCTLQGGRGEPCIQPLPQDRRFEAEAWGRRPSASSPSPSCSRSNGGTTRRPMCAE